MLTAFFVGGAVRDYGEAAQADTAAFAQWFQALLSRGIYWAPSQFESIFVSAAHTPADLDLTLGAAEAAFAQIKELA